MTTDELRYDGQVALVTGAGRGLGREHALLLASRGCKIVVNDPGIAYDGTGIAQHQVADEVVEEIKRAGGIAVGFGISMLLGGITQLLTPTPQGPNASPEQASSTSFPGNAGAIAQGIPVPIVYVARWSRHSLCPSP